jgi:Right handed beta helix region
VVISFAPRDRAFHVFGPARVTISGVTIKNGNTGNNFDGGGVRNSGTLSIARSTIANNADLGIFNLGSLRIITSTVRDNGGGIRNHGSDGHLEVIASTISGNSGAGLVTPVPARRRR